MAQPRFFYGWVIVACAFTVLFVGFGIAYSFAAFFLTFQAEFAASRADVSLIFSICGFLYFMGGAVSGPIADRLGPRWVAALGMAVMAAGLYLASWAEALWQVYLAYALAVGIGVGFSYVPAVGAVQHWFVRRRGLASGLAVSGIGAGTLAGAPAAVWLIDWLGWRGTYVAMGGLALAVGASAALLIERSPARRGLAPDGDPPPPKGAPEATAEPTAGAGSIPGATLRQALGSRPFWLLYGGGFLASLGLFIPFVHLAAYAHDHGIAESTGVLLVGLIGGGSIAGRFLLGAGADRLGRRRSLAITFAGMAVMLLWWLASTELWSLVAFALVFGAFYGGFVAVSPALTADYFGGRNVSAIIGFLYTGAGIGALAGPLLAGLAFDLTGSYTLAIAGGAMANLAAFGCVMLMVEPARYRPRA